MHVAESVGAWVALESGCVNDSDSVPHDGGVPRAGHRSREPRIEVKGR